MAKADTFGSCDACAVVRWKNVEIGNTPTVRNSLNPRWRKKNGFGFEVDDRLKESWQKMMEEEREGVSEREKLKEDYVPPERKRDKIMKIGSFMGKSMKKSIGKRSFQMRKSVGKSSFQMKERARKAGGKAKKRIARASDQFKETIKERERSLRERSSSEN